MSRPRWLGALLADIAAEAPADLLLVAPRAVADALRERAPSLRATSELAAAVPTLQRRFAWALAVDAIEGLSADAARELLAALRDRVAGHTLVGVDLAHAPLSEQDLRALGYRVHARDGARVLFGFDLNDYKDRPDWLDARHWAHPELWDRFRW